MAGKINNQEKMELTGNSSFWFQTPVHCLCSITALMLIKAGSATQPAEKLGDRRGNVNARPVPDSLVPEMSIPPDSVCRGPGAGQGAEPSALLNWCVCAHTRINRF